MTEGRTFGKVLLAGAGLIGASLGLALRQRGLADGIFGFGRSAENLDVARRRGAIDRYSLDPEVAARNVDLIVLAVPVRSMRPVLESLLPAARPDVLVTDVGSVKDSVARDLEPLVRSPAAFVGSHPIAGTEHSGAAHASSNLFTGRRCIVTPTERTEESARKRIVELWENVGMRVEVMDPRAHDRLLALVSHLPHAVAFSLVGSVEAERVGGRDPLRFTGGSFRDTTRVAASHPGMWRDIFLENRDEVLRAMSRFEEAFARFRDAIAAGSPEELLREIDRLRKARSRLEEE